MIGIHGRLQREGKVTHIVTERIEDLTPLLHQVGDRPFPHRTGPGDGARNGGYDPRERVRRPLPSPRPTAACASARATFTKRFRLSPALVAL